MGNPFAYPQQGALTSQPTRGARKQQSPPIVPLPFDTNQNPSPLPPYYEPPAPAPGGTGTGINPMGGWVDAGYGTGQLNADGRQFQPSGGPLPPAISPMNGSGAVPPYGGLGGDANMAPGDQPQPSSPLPPAPGPVWGQRRPRTEINNWRSRY